MRGEFLLCHGDLVTNLKLSGVIETHRARMGRDKNGVMTKVMMAGGEGDVTSELGDPDPGSGGVPRAQEPWVNIL